MKAVLIRGVMILRWGGKENFGFFTIVCFQWCSRGLRRFGCSISDLINLEIEHPTSEINSPLV